MHSTRIVAAAVAALSLWSLTSAQAQGRDTTRQQGGMHQMGGMQQAGGQQGMGDMQGMCTLMSAMHEGPDAALTHAQHINLTDAQRTRLETAKDRVQQAHTRAMEQMQLADREIGTAARAPRANDAALRAAFRRMADAHAQAAAAMLRARAETQATLTAEQRTQLAQLTQGGGPAMGMTGRQPMMGRDSMRHQMGRDSMRHPMRDSMVRMTPRQPMMGDSGRTMPMGQRMMSDSSARGAMAGGHMGMMGMMMMMHCGTGPAPDSARAHQH